MRYKEKIVTHAEYIEGNIERLIQDVESNRVNKQTLINSLKAILVKSDYLLNLINLEE
tara:strand:- start:130 stop:303 length:174 start_codon:yes stop_codon:yes gene_type:complete